MLDREKVIKGLECCIRHGENAEVGCGKKNECPYERNGLKCWLDLNRDSLALLKEQEIVRCKDCCHWKPPHIVLNDGRQRAYVEGDKDNDPFGIGVSADVGLNVGGKCWVSHNCGYGRDMRVFRQENDYCSRAVKLPEGTTAEEYWGLSAEPKELGPDNDD